MNKELNFLIFLVPPELMSDRSLSISSRIILGRLFCYTKKATRECWPTNQQLADECGLSYHSVVNAIAELTRRKLISCKCTQYKNKKVRYISVNYSQKAYISDCSSNELSSDEHSSNEHQLFIKRTFDSSSNELSSPIYIEKGKKNTVVENAREKNDNSDSAHALNDVPLPDDSDFYETEENTESEPDLNDLYGTECTYNAQEHANPPQTSNYTSNTSNTLSAQSSNEIEGVRRQLTIPTSPEEVIPLIEKFKNAHKAEKVYEKLDVSFYAGKIFDYYAGADGVWRDNRGNEIPPYRIFQKISTWIVNDQRAGKLQRILSGGTMTSEDLSQAMAEIIEKKDREQLALMQKFGIKPPPVNATFEVLEGDEQNEQKLLEAK